MSPAVAALALYLVQRGFIAPDAKYPGIVRLVEMTRILHPELLPEKPLRTLNLLRHFVRALHLRKPRIGGRIH